tara:strand:+ start:462 stop:1040 length:579 start_codon:yes stop_codon:yes gene_type:complete
MPDNIYTTTVGAQYKMATKADGGLRVYPGTTALFPYTFQSTLEVLANLNAGSTSNHRIYSSGDIIAYSSDKRLKKNIVDISNPLEKIEKLRGVYFNWNQKSVDVGFNVSIPENPEIGMIAQELEAVIPEAVHRAPFDSTKNAKLYKHHGNGSYERLVEDDPYKTVKLEKVVPLLIECIKELNNKIKELKAEK